MVRVSPTQNPDGASFQKEYVVLTADEAITKGDIVTLELASGGFASVAKTAVTDDVTHLPIGVALEDITNGSKGQIGVAGVFDCTVESTVAAGNALTVSGATAGKLHEAQAPGTPAEAKKIVGVALTAASGGSASVLFDGINGFSQYASAAQS
jgi:predicted RecA/RadA family phage recombinase